MTRLDYFGGWYCDSLPSGERAVLFPLKKVVGTHQTELEYPEEPLFIVVSNVGGLKFAGKSHDSNKSWEYIGGNWFERPEAIGNFSLIYDHLGALHISQGGAVGSQGWRYEAPAPTWRLMTGDETYGPLHGLNEWTDLSLTQDRSMMIGQGHDGGGVQIYDAGIMRRLGPSEAGESTECYAIRAHRHDTLVSVAYYDVAPDGLTAHLAWLTVDELQRLPLITDPLPEPIMSERFWIGPNIGSADMVRIFDDPATLAPIEVFSLYAQNILSPTDTVQLNGNTFDALQANHAFKKLAQAGIPLAIEGQAVSDLDAVAKINGVGGDLVYYSYNEPLADLLDRPTAGVTFDTKLADMVAFIQKATGMGVHTGWLEAWPRTDLATQERFLRGLYAAGVTLAYWHLDIDWHLADSKHLSISGHVAGCQKLADEFHFPLGVFLAGYDHPTDLDYANDVTSLAHRLWGISPALAHVCVQSWALRKPGSEKQDIPNNLGTDGLLKSYVQIQTLFQPISPPTTEPPPNEGVIMLTTIIDKPPVAVKEVKAVAGHTGLFTLVLTDDTVFSMQPDKTDGTRPAGTEGQYEKCTVDGSMATFYPNGEYLSRWFARVGGL